jgi:formimidoylglutamate deiminase
LLSDSNQTSWQADFIYEDGLFRNCSLSCDTAGLSSGLVPSNKSANQIILKDRAVLPGLINAHSHAFQRVIRGRTEYRTSHSKDSFWTWREMMYSAATRLTPEDVYDASRMAFLEMALSGITSVGEFHYLHHNSDGVPYDDPNLLAKEVVRAANDVGLRIALLRVAYARSGFETEANPQQLRFIESDPETYLKHLEQLASDLKQTWANDMAWIGIAPHSVRAVPLEYLKTVIAFAKEKQLPTHMHLAEQPAEVSACIAEHGRSPVALLETEGLLSEWFTGVHAIHVTPKAVAMLARARAMVCACPTTERNLGDGIVSVDDYFQQDVRVALGTDSHVEIDLLEDAREIEYNLRLKKIERVVLANSGSPTLRKGSVSSPDPGGAIPDGRASALAARLFECATRNGAESINSPGGSLTAGRAADFFTVDLNDPSIAGASPDVLLSNIVFSLSRKAVKDVVVGGKRIVEDGRHADQEEIVERFKALQKKLWS